MSIDGWTVDSDCYGQVCGPGFGPRFYLVRNWAQIRNRTIFFDPDHDFWSGSDFKFCTTDQITDQVRVRV